MEKIFLTSSLQRVSGPKPVQSVADPEFPIGGGGGRQPPMWALFGKMYAKIKELDPVGGHRQRPLDPPMTIVLV